MAGRGWVFSSAYLFYLVSQLLIQRYVTVNGNGSCFWWAEPQGWSFRLRWWCGGGAQIWVFWIVKLMHREGVRFGV